MMYCVWNLTIIQPDPFTQRYRTSLQDSRYLHSKPLEGRNTSKENRQHTVQNQDFSTSLVHHQQWVLTFSLWYRRRHRLSRGWIELLCTRKESLLNYKTKCHGIALRKLQIIIHSRNYQFYFSQTQRYVPTLYQSLLYQVASMGELNSSTRAHSRHVRDLGTQAMIASDLCHFPIPVGSIKTFGKGIWLAAEPRTSLRLRPHPELHRNQICRQKTTAIDRRCQQRPQSPPASDTFRRCPRRLCTYILRVKTTWRKAKLRVDGTSRA